MRQILDQRKLFELEVKDTQANRIKEIHTRLVKNFLNIVILINLKGTKGLSGYDIVKKIQQKHGIRLCGNSVYRVVHAMEYAELIKGKRDDNGRILYSLSPQGKIIINDILKSRKEIEMFMCKIFDS